MWETKWNRQWLDGIEILRLCNVISRAFDLPVILFSFFLKKEKRCLSSSSESLTQGESHLTLCTASSAILVKKLQTFCHFCI